MSIVSVLAASALAADPSPGSPDELAAAERAATELIERCQTSGRACGVTSEALGQAFVVRALAAAVLRGELDQKGVANARLLAPGAVEAWSDVLPAAGRVGPEAWVVAFLVPNPTPRPAWKASPAPAGSESPASGAQRTTPNTVIRGSGDTLAMSNDHLAYGGVVDFRTASGTLGVLVRGTLHEVAIDHQWRGDLYVPSLTTREGALELNAGPRWVGPGGAEVLPHAGMMVYSGGFTHRAADDLEAQGFTGDPAAVGIGSRVGALGVHPLRPGGPVLATWRADAAVGWSQTLARPLDRSRTPPDSVVGQQYPIDVWLRAEPGLEWRSAGGMLLGVSAPIGWVWDRGSERPATFSGGAAATVGWTLDRSS